MRVATYNINSVNARLPELLKWLEQKQPDIVLLQEIKCDFNAFPFFELGAIGYNVRMLGQKSYNGVAVLSRHKLKTIREGLPDFTDENARYLEVLVHFKDNSPVRVASIYLPNGNPPSSDPDDTSKFEYKLSFMDALYRHAVSLRQKREAFILGGDLNVILTPKDVYDPSLFKNNALYREPVKQRLTALTYLGLNDAFRLLHKDDTAYTYWDYSGKAFEQDLGLRIDYLLISPILADCLKDCRVDTSLRAGEKPSDHAPLTAVFEYGDMHD